MLDTLIRDELPSDVEPIARVTREAFADHPHSQQTEAFIVAALRRSGALAVSLVAEVSGAVVGHVAFSPVALGEEGSGWYGLGPLSVDPAFQKQGIGRALVVRGLERLREMGARGCVLVGEPAFYARFGFANDPNLRFPGVPPEYFQALAFGTEPARGEVTFAAAFSAVS